jgi:3-methylfumaryl-CoA hydratase
MTVDLQHLRQWVGASETQEDRLAAFPASAMAATLDRDDPPYADGSVLPKLWHWLYFLPIHKRSASGHDGHAALGGFLPPVPLPRRMWAGGRLRFLAPLRIGQVLRKISSVLSVDHKAGRSGDLVFVTVRHQIQDGAQLCLEEEHDIVYRAAAKPGAPQAIGPLAPPESRFSRVVQPDPVLLFRYSALTFNGHRIHYDHPFCTGTEGYPGLVVHGPLLATLMVELLRDKAPDQALTGFEFRALAPVFDTDTFSVHASPDETGLGWRLWVQKSDGTMAMTATAETIAQRPPSDEAPT